MPTNKKKKKKSFNSKSSNQNLIDYIIHQFKSILVYFSGIELKIIPIKIRAIN